MTMQIKGFKVPLGYIEPPRHDEAYENLYQRVVGGARRLIKLFGLEVSVYGAEHIPAEGGALIAGNHTGYADFMLMGTGPHLRGERLVRFMAKKSVFEVPLVGHVMHKMRHVPVDRKAGASSVDAAVDNLGRGLLVGIFPEATISRSFELANFKTGAARIAHQSGAPLIPCAIWGSQRIWTKDLPKRLRGVPVIVRYGEPVALTGDAEADTAELKRRMQELLDASREEYATRYGSGEGEAWMPQSLGGTAPTLEEAEELYAAERAERDRKKAAKREKRARRKRGKK